MQSFVRLAEVGNFTRAAESLYTAQSSLSAQIKSLEQELGVTLVERGSRMISLTDAGRRFLLFCQQTLDAYDVLLRDLAGLSETPVITIGLFYGSRLESWCDRISRANSSGEGARYNIRILYGNEKLQALRRGEIDIGFCLRSPELEQQGFRFKHVLYDRYCLAIPYTNELFTQEEVGLSDLSGARILVIDPSVTGADQIIISKLVHVSELSREQFISKHTLDEIRLSMKAEGLVALLPSELAPSSSRKVSLPEEASERMDYGWYYRNATPGISWVLENLC